MLYLKRCPRHADLVKASEIGHVSMLLHLLLSFNWIVCPMIRMHLTCFKAEC